MRVFRRVFYLPALFVGALLLLSCGVVPTPTPPVPPTPTAAPSPSGTTAPSATPRRATPTRAVTRTPAVTPTTTAEATITAPASPEVTATAGVTLTVTPGASPAITGTITPGINITSQQYDEALAKWRAQGVQEYEMAVRYVSFSPWAGVYNLRVTGENIEVLSYSDVAGTPGPAPASGETLKFLTIAGLFASIDYRMTNPSPTELESMVDWTVTFDETLGYPRLVSQTARPGALVADVDNIVTVESLTVTRR